MKRKVDLEFNYDIDNYKAGYAYTLEITEAEEKRLLRRGCIYPSKDAKYYKEEKPVKEKVEVKEVVVETKPEKEVEENVDNKDMEQTKVQTRRTNKRKSKA